MTSFTLFSIKKRQKIVRVSASLDVSADYDDPLHTRLRLSFNY